MSGEAHTAAGCEEVDEIEEAEYTLGAFTEANIYQVHPGTMSASGDFLADSWTEKHFITAVCGEILVHGERVRIVMKDLKSRELFAECIVEDETSVTDTVDSSRYVVMKLKDPASGRVALLGMGWRERTNAYDFKATLRDHQKRMQFRKQRKQEPRAPSRDYNIAADQKIKLNFKKRADKPKPKSTGGLQALKLPGPKSAAKKSAAKPAAAAAAGSDNSTQQVDPFASAGVADGFGDVDPFAAANTDPFSSPFSAADPFSPEAETGFGDFDPFSAEANATSPAAVDPFAAAPIDPFTASTNPFAEPEKAPETDELPAAGTQEEEAEDIPAKLIQLKQLFDLGVINEVDFETKKKDLLTRM